LILAAVYWWPLSDLVRLSLLAGYSSHIVLLPFIATYLVWSERSKIFSTPESGWSIGFLFCILGIAAGIGAFFVAPRYPAASVPFFTVLSVLLLVIGGFVGWFGKTAFRQSLFPILLLALMLPVPSVLVERIIHFLQAGSADLTYRLFSLLGVPVLRNGFLLTVPGVTIEVAEECSGINSSIALFIVTLLFAHETLASNFRRAILMFLVLPLSILKNAIRIVTLTLLATKVDPSFITGRLHHEGGFVFFLITLAVAYPIWKLLRTNERQQQGPARTDIARFSTSSLN
jgi:exosortase